MAELRLRRPGRCGGKLIAVLLYQLEQGPTEKFLVDQSRQNKRPIPKKILNAPVLMPGLEFYFTAFAVLSSCRSIGMAEGRIPWTAVNEYSLRYGLSENDFTILYELINRMDGAYLDFQAKRVAKGKEKPVSSASKEPTILHTGKRK